MAEVKDIVPFIKKWEGGFVNDPIDKGGATNMGITIGTFKHHRKKKGLGVPSVQDLKNISDDEWTEVLKSLYWDRWQADRINNQSLANLLVDWVWGSGVHGIKIPQRILGVDADGIVGSKTIDALNSKDPEEIFNKIWKERKAFFEGIVNRSVISYTNKLKESGKTPSEADLLKYTQKRFLKGWLNRLNDYKFYNNLEARIDSKIESNKKDVSESINELRYLCELLKKEIA